MNKAQTIRLLCAWLLCFLFLSGNLVLSGAEAAAGKNPVLEQELLASWKKNILQGAKNRHCDKAMGEELGWLVSPFLEGFFYGYQATQDTMWLDLLIDWSDSIIKRGVPEPDGFMGWPKVGATGSKLTKQLYTDSELGEAMVFRPIVLASTEILKKSELKEKYGGKASEYIKLSEQIFLKWEQRGGWREVSGGGVTVTPPFGIDQDTGKWSSEYEQKDVDGFSHPANKQNMIACWYIALFDATQKPIYKDHAEKWWRLMRSRMRVRDEKFFVWDYWNPAGPWDYKNASSPKHWVGIHPNGQYYSLDVEGIVTAYEHGLVFTKEDLDRLIATNRDFMWNQKLEGASFQRIDGGLSDPRWLKTPGVIWMWLTPYDATLREVFIKNHDPASWIGLSATPQFLARDKIYQQEHP